MATTKTTKVAFITLNRKRHYITVDQYSSELITFNGNDIDNYQELINVRGADYAKAMKNTGTLKFQSVAMYEKRVATQEQNSAISDHNKAVKNTIKAVSQALNIKNEESLRKKKKAILPLLDSLNKTELNRRDFFLKVVDSLESLTTYKVPANVKQFANDLK